jgi:hypothetical protein
VIRARLHLVQLFSLMGDFSVANRLHDVQYLPTHRRNPRREEFDMTEITVTEIAAPDPIKIGSAGYHAGEAYANLRAAFWAEDSRAYLHDSALDSLRRAAAELGYELTPAREAEQVTA